MFTPPNFTVALLMTVASAVCWGSWANTYKGVKNYRFELFYWDYAIGIFLISLVGALTLGSTGHDSTSFLNNVHSADNSNILWTMVGGAIFNLANLLLVAAIDMAGLAVALPVSIGIALVVGTMLSYILQPKGNLLFIAAGVACALIAVILDGKAFGSLPGGRTASKKSIVICIVSGVLMGLWNPFVAYGATRGQCADALQFRRISHAGRAALVLHLESVFHEEAAGRRTGGLFRIFQRAALGTSAGIARRNDLGDGDVCNVVAGGSAGFALSYAIGQSAPMVGALWGVFAWKEFAGAGSKAKIFLTLMFVFYALAILVLAHASG